MSKPSKPAAAQRSASNKRPSAGSSPSEPVFLPPLRPHRRLTIALGILLTVWLIGLLVAYFITVYPLRHEQPPATRSIIEPK